MNETRWNVWLTKLRQGHVRYRTAEFKCLDCERWHTVTAKHRNVRYDERNDTLEDVALNALRTSATHGCLHKKQASKKKPTEEVDRREETS